MLSTRLTVPEGGSHRLAVAFGLQDTSQDALKKVPQRD